tara:strand:+ start:107 stop:217 length:111 start_codon:yes stop_codon:yes gene_type:complete
VTSEEQIKAFEELELLLQILEVVNDEAKSIQTIGWI